MNHRADGNVLDGKRVADLDVSLCARLHLVADLEAVRCEDVALLAVRVVQESDASAAVRIVLDRRDAGGDAVLRALEVDDTVAALVTAALMANRHAALLIASAMALEALDEGFLRLVRRDFVKRRDRHEPSACGIRFETFDCHFFLPPLLDFMPGRTRSSRRERASRSPSCSPSACRRSDPCASPCR